MDSSCFSESVDLWEKDGIQALPFPDWQPRQPTPC